MRPFSDGVPNGAFSLVPKANSPMTVAFSTPSIALRSRSASSPPSIFTHLPPSSVHVIGSWTWPASPIPSMTPSTTAVPCVKSSIPANATSVHSGTGLTLWPRARADHRAMQVRRRRHRKAHVRTATAHLQLVVHHDRPAAALDHDLGDRLRLLFAIVVADDRDDVALLDGEADVDDQRRVLQEVWRDDSGHGVTSLSRPKRPARLPWRSARPVPPGRSRRSGR